MWLGTWALGLAGLVGLNAFAVTPRIEQRLLADVRTAVAPIVTSPVMVSVSGHAATITGPVSGDEERDALLNAMADIAGVREVVDRLEAPDDASAEPDTPPATELASLADPAEAPVELPPDPSEVPDEAPGETSGELPRAEAELAMIDTQTGDGSDDAIDDTPPQALPGNDVDGGPAPVPDALPDGPDEPEEALADSRPAGTATPSLSLALVDRALTLEGRMSATDDITLLIQPALDAFDPSYLTNRVDTTGAVDDADWLTPLAALLPELEALSDVSIDIDERQVTLAGSAPSRSEHDRVIDVALEAFDDYALVERVDVVAPPVGDAPVGSDDASALPAPAAATQGERDVASELRTAIDGLDSPRILFESSRAVLTDGSVARLDELADLFDRYADLSIEIEGHTDASGPADANLSLSQARASAVRQALVDRGIPAGRLAAYGYGEGVPLVDNTTPEGRARNRRIEFRF